MYLGNIKIDYKISREIYIIIAIGLPIALLIILNRHSTTRRATGRAQFAAKAVADVTAVKDFRARLLAGRSVAVGGALVAALEVRALPRTGLIARIAFVAAGSRALFVDAAVGARLIPARRTGALARHFTP